IAFGQKARPSALPKTANPRALSPEGPTNSGPAQADAAALEKVDGRVGHNSALRRSEGLPLLRRAVSLLKRVRHHDAAKGSKRRAGYRAGEPNHDKTDGAADHGSYDDKRDSARRKGALFEDFRHGTSPLWRGRLAGRRVLALSCN